MSAHCEWKVGILVTLWVSSLYLELCTQSLQCWLKQYGMDVYVYWVGNVKYKPMVKYYVRSVLCWIENEIQYPDPKNHRGI